ncbi:MAG TPA: hypothetical protein VH878_02095 [Thermodesulfobacteriota bacterium]
MSDITSIIIVIENEECFEIALRTRLGSPFREKKHPYYYLIPFVRIIVAYQYPRPS